MSKREEMFRMISRWQRSGKKQKAWCQKQGIAYATFHYWYRKYQDQYTGVSDEQPREEAFLPVIRSLPSLMPWCEVVGSNGSRVIFHHGVDPGYLKTLLD